MIRMLVGSAVRGIFGKRVATELKRFFQTDLTQLVTHNRHFYAVDLPNIQLALRALAEEGGATVRALGYSSDFEFMGTSLGQLIGGIATVGPVKYRQVDVGEDRPLACVENGIHLIHFPDKRVAAHVRFETMQGNS